MTEREREMLFWIRLQVTKPRNQEQAGRAKESAVSNFPCNTALYWLRQSGVGCLTAQIIGGKSLIQMLSKTFLPQFLKVTNFTIWMKLLFGTTNFHWNWGDEAIFAQTSSFNIFKTPKISQSRREEKKSINSKLFGHLHPRVENL